MKGDGGEIVFSAVKEKVTARETAGGRDPADSPKGKTKRGGPAGHVHWGGGLHRPLGR